MTITLQLGHTYRTRDGQTVGPMINGDKHRYYGDWEFTVDQYLDTGGTGRAWRADGTFDDHSASNEHALDLVEEVLPATTPTASSPVRQRTITTTEIVPDTYGRLIVFDFPLTDTGDVSIALVPKFGGEAKPVHMSADELDAAAATMTALAAALRQIAKKKEQTNG